MVRIEQMFCPVARRRKCRPDTATPKTAQEILKVCSKKMKRHTCFYSVCRYPTKQTFSERLARNFYQNRVFLSLSSVCSARPGENGRLHSDERFLGVLVGFTFSSSLSCMLLKEPRITWQHRFHRFGNFPLKLSGVSWSFGLRSNQPVNNMNLVLAHVAVDAHGKLSPPSL